MHIFSKKGRTGIDDRDQSLANYIFKKRLACFQRKQERRDRLAAFQRKREWDLTRELGGFAKMVLKKTDQGGPFFEIMPLAWHTWRDRYYRSYLFFLFFSKIIYEVFSLFGIHYMQSTHCH